MILASAIDSSSMRLAGIVGAAFPDFDDFDVAQTEIAAGLRRALAEALGKFGFRALLQASDGGNDDAHRCAELSVRCRFRVRGWLADHIFSRL